MATKYANKQALNYPKNSAPYATITIYPLLSLGTFSVTIVKPRGAKNPIKNPSIVLDMANVVVFQAKAAKKLVNVISPIDHMIGFYLPCLSAKYPQVPAPRTTPINRDDASKDAVKLSYFH